MRIAGPVYVVSQCPKMQWLTSEWKCTWAGRWGSPCVARGGVRRGDRVSDRAKGLARGRVPLGSCLLRGRRHGPRGWASLRRGGREQAAAAGRRRGGLAEGTSPAAAASASAALPCWALPGAGKLAEAGSVVWAAAGVASCCMPPAMRAPIHHGVGCPPEPPLSCVEAAATAAALGAAACALGATKPRASPAAAAALLRCMRRPRGVSATRPCSRRGRGGTPGGGEAGGGRASATNGLLEYSSSLSLISDSDEL